MLRQAGGSGSVSPHVYLTKLEAAERARVSRSTIERAIRAGDLQAGGTPNRVLIRPEWIDEWIGARRPRGLRQS
jgi:excisionase family DNA binding protein